MRPFELPGMAKQQFVALAAPIAMSANWDGDMQVHRSKAIAMREI
jgi:hypothetical protein